MLRSCISHPNLSIFIRQVGPRSNPIVGILLQFCISLLSSTGTLCIGHKKCIASCTSLPSSLTELNVASKNVFFFCFFFISFSVVTVETRRGYIFIYIFIILIYTCVCVCVHVCPTFVETITFNVSEHSKQDAREIKAQNTVVSYVIHLSVHLRLRSVLVHKSDLMITNDRVIKNGRLRAGSDR